MKKIVFPDATVFLHFLSLEEIDLPELLDCAEVEVVLTPVVMEELIRHQWDHPVPELRQRAKERLKQVESWLVGQHPHSPAVTATFFSRRPGSEIMERSRLNWQHQTDVLLGMLLAYQQVRDGRQVILLAGDDTLALQARSLGVEGMTLPDEFALADAEDGVPEEKQALSQVLAGSHYRAPSLWLSFAGGKSEAEVALLPQLDALTPAMQAQLVAVVDKMRRQMAQNPSEDVLEGAVDDLDMLATLAQQAPEAGHSLLGRMAEEEAERYRREIEAYPEKYERYLHHCLEAINEDRRTIRLDLEVGNAGGAPAENVSLLLTVPEQLEWYWQPGESTMPAPPAPPAPPGPQGQVLERGFHFGQVSPLPSKLLSQTSGSDPIPAGAAPVISKAGTQLRWELGTYRHHQSRLLEPLYIRFRHADRIANCAVTYELQEKNGPGPVQGLLLVLLE